VTNFGWKWVDEGRRTCAHPGCRKYGWTSKTPGSYIEFEFDSSKILSEEQSQNEHRISLVMLFLRSHGNNPNDEQGAKNGMGTALITCVSGCECEPLKVDAVNTDRASELDTIRTTVSAAAAVQRICQVPAVKERVYRANLHMFPFAVVFCCCRLLLCCCMNLMHASASPTSTTPNPD
jgi:hypothetical protein